MKASIGRQAGKKVGRVLRGKYPAQARPGAFSMLCVRRMGPDRQIFGSRRPRQSWSRAEEVDEDERDGGER